MQKQTINKVHTQGLGAYMAVDRRSTVDQLISVLSYTIIQEEQGRFIRR